MSDSPVSRRRFLQGLGLSVAAVSASPLLSACGGGSSGLSGDQGRPVARAANRRSTSGTTSTARRAPSRRSSATPRNIRTGP